MEKQATQQFRLEPGGLRRHDLAGISQRHELINGGRIKREGNLELAVVHQPDQFFRATAATDEMDPLIGTRVTHAKNRA